MMKKPLVLLSLLAGLSLSAGTLTAGDTKEVTITGDGMCAKCELGETDQCQTAISVNENGHEVVYYLADNAAAKAYHKTICRATVKTTATGTVEMKDGKHVLVASKVEKAE